MCITSGGYALENVISDKVSIGYAPSTTYNNDGQPKNIYKQITRER